MPTVDIIINVGGTPYTPPPTGVSLPWTDIDPGPAPLVTLSLKDNTGVTSYFWELLDQAPGASATLSSQTAASPTFPPTVSKAGTYLIRCVINGEATSDANEGTYWNTNALAFRTEYEDLRIPAAGEKTEYSDSVGWKQTDIYQSVDALAATVSGTDLNDAYDNFGANPAQVFIDNAELQGNLVFKPTAAYDFKVDVTASAGDDINGFQVVGPGSKFFNFLANNTKTTMNVQANVGSISAIVAETTGFALSANSTPDQALVFSAINSGSGKGVVSFSSDEVTVNALTNNAVDNATVLIESQGGASASGVNVDLLLAAFNTSSANTVDTRAQLSAESSNVGTANAFLLATGLTANAGDATVDIKAEQQNGGNPNDATVKIRTVGTGGGTYLVDIDSVGDVNIDAAGTVVSVSPWTITTPDAANEIPLTLTNNDVTTGTRPPVLKLVSNPAVTATPHTSTGEAIQLTSTSDYNIIKVADENLIISAATSATSRSINVVNATNGAGGADAAFFAQGDSGSSGALTASIFANSTPGSSSNPTAAIKALAGSGSTATAITAELKAITGSTVGPAVVDVIAQSQAPSAANATLNLTADSNGGTEVINLVSARIETNNGNFVMSGSDKDIGWDVSTGSYGTIRWRSTAQTVDTTLFMVGNVSNHIVVCQAADRSYDFSHAQTADPTIFIHSANQDTTEWGSLAHDRTNFVIKSGAGNISFSPASNVSAFSGWIRMGDANALLTTGSVSNFGTIQLRNTSQASAITPTLLTGSGSTGSNHWLMMAYANRSGNYGHTPSTNPEFIIHSGTAAGTATDEWISFYHNVTDPCINWGSGDLDLVGASASAITTETLTEYVNIKIGGVAKKLALVA